MTEHKLCDAIIAWIEQSWMKSDNFLDVARLERFQNLWRDALALFAPLAAASAEAGNSSSELKIPGCDSAFYLSKSFRSKEAALELYKSIFRKLYKHLPMSTGQLEANCTDPFMPPSDINPDDRIYAFPAILLWGLRGYERIIQLCTTSEKVKYGCAKTRDAAEKMIEFLDEHGFGELLMRDNPTWKVNTYFGADAGEMKFDSQEGKRHILPAILPLLNRSDAKPPFDYDQFMNAMIRHLGMTAQSCIKARYYVLVLPARREQLYIEGIKKLQDKVRNQLIAACVTLGITAGQVVAPMITAWIKGE
jgi:hypothetical protein